MSASPADLTIGRLLCKRRTEEGLSVEQAAEDTRIRASFIMSMESDDFDFLAPVYVHGHLEAYARYLGLEPEPLLSEFESHHEPSNDVLQVIHETYDVGPRHISVTMIAGIALVVLVGLGIWNPGASNGDRIPSTSAETSTSDEPAEVSDVTAPETSATAPDASGTTTITSGASGIRRPNISFANGIDSRIAAASGPCWVEVTADGQTVFSGMLEPGTIKSFKAKGDMQLLLGLPASAELLVNGHQLTLPKLSTPIRIALPTEAKRYL